MPRYVLFIILGELKEIFMEEKKFDEALTEALEKAIHLVVEIEIGIDH